MGISDKSEEILETLWVELEEKKNKLDPAVFRDNSTFKELETEGYINLSGDKVSFTERGEKEARLCVRRHRLAERMMADILALKKDLIHEAGCKFEHALHKGVEENICTLLGHPKVCPHGERIPEGVCCHDAKRKPEKLIVPLSEMTANQKGKIAYLHTEDKDTLKKIMAMGALPGQNIVLTQKFPSYVFKIGQSQFAIDQEMALCIYVRL